MIHLDLFSGIGGFAYAADQVFGDVEHIFCDNDKFCQQVLNKHWPEAKIYDDIRSITADSYISRYIHGQPGQQPAGQPHEAQREFEPSVRPSSIQSDVTDTTLTRARKDQRGLWGKSKRHNERQQVDLLTGGFPCQPFSQAGARLGTADDRHLWPEMLRVIRLTKPEWVIAENVRGLLTWDEGVVFEQVCTDLEAEGYEVQPFIIPAVAVNAPHRRDRIWFVAHAINDRQGREKRQSDGAQDSLPQKHRSQNSATREPKRAINDRQNDQYDSNAINEGLQRSERFGTPSQRARPSRPAAKRSWDENWLEVATELCGVDDGLPARLDGFELSKPQHRVQRLKSLGNAIVPQVAIEIMKGMVGHNINT